MRGGRFTSFAYLLLLHTWGLDAQVSKPIVRNDQTDANSNKYLQRINEEDVDNAER